MIYNLNLPIIPQKKTTHRVMSLTQLLLF